MTKQTTAALAIILFAMMAAPAQATPPIDVHLEVTTNLIGDPDPFDATGPAVDDGLVCESGSVEDDLVMVVGFSETGFNLRVIKRFICDDGSGEFLVNLQVRIDVRRGITFHWNVMSGTGHYVDLHGASSGVGLPLCGEDCVLDIYEGGLHID